MKRKALILALLAVLVLAGGVLAMNSPNYRLTWYVPLTGGGGTSSSAHYQAQITIGQSVTGLSNGTTAVAADACFGFWCGVFPPQIYLPFLRR